MTVNYLLLGSLLLSFAQAFEMFDKKKGPVKRRLWKGEKGQKITTLLLDGFWDGRSAIRIPCNIGALGLPELRNLPALCEDEPPQMRGCILTKFQVFGTDESL